MKKNIVLAFIALGLASTAFSQSKTKEKAKGATKSIAAPAAVESTFNIAHEGARSVGWAKTANGNYVARFKNAEGFNETVAYTKGGDFVSSRISYKADALPETVTTALTKNYDGWRITDGYKTTLPSVAPFYKVIIKNKDGKSKEILISEQGAVAE